MRKFIPYITRDLCAKIWIDEILYIEKLGRQLKIETSDREYLAYMKFNEAIEYIDQRFFVFENIMVINFAQVSSMQGQIIHFRCGKTCEMGANDYVYIKQYFARYRKNFSMLQEQKDDRQAKRTNAWQKW